MRVTLEYGKTGLQVELPTERVVRSLGYKNALPLADPAAELARKLAAPTGTRPLAELARGRQERLCRDLRHYAAGAEPADPLASSADA